MSITSEQGNIDSCSLLKKNNLEEFIEENILEPEGDEDKTKRSFSFSLSPPTMIVHLVHEAYDQGFHNMKVKFLLGIAHWLRM